MIDDSNTRTIGMPDGQNVVFSRDYEGVWSGRVGEDRLIADPAGVAHVMAIAYEMLGDVLKQEDLASMTERLYATSDAAVWADEFCRVARGIGVDPNDPEFEGWMTGWFANAMQTAVDLDHQNNINEPGSPVADWSQVR